LRDFRASTMSKQGDVGQKPGFLGLKTAYSRFGMLCASLSAMSDLRPLLRIRKTAGYALAIALLLTAVGLCPAAEPASRPAAGSTTRPATKPATRPTTRPASPGYFALSDNGGGDLTGLMWQMLSAALVVLVIGALALFVVKKLLPRIRYTSHRRISVLETAYLGSRKAVHLLQVGSIKLLVASSPEGVVRLDDVTFAFSSEYADIAQRVEAETDAADRSGDPRGADSDS